MPRYRGCPVAVGDWVHSYTEGIWQVFRVVSGVYELRYGLQERRRVQREDIVLNKRLLNRRWQPSFGAESCESGWAEPLTASEKERLESYIRDNPETLREYKAYKPKSLDLMMSLPLGLPADFDEERLTGLLSEAFADLESEGLTNEQVLQRLDAYSLHQYLAPGQSNFTVRFLCKDHEVRDNEFVFRVADCLPF